jgi:cytochrome P450
VSILPTTRHHENETLIKPGFLDQGHDIDGAISALQKVVMYSTLVGVYPEWHPRLFSILSKIKSTGAGGRAYISKFVQDKIRLHEQKTPNSETETTTQDFVEKLMLARAKDPEKVTDYHLFIMGQSNVIAGSDTTAISLSSIMWHLLSYPETLHKLRSEIDEFTTSGRCGSTPSFSETLKMPYFQAVMKEALRMHAATGLPMWRTVPDGGAEIQGRIFPAGTVVGINTWVAHYDESVFPDARTFRPERWLEAEDSAEKLKEMNQMYMPVSESYRRDLICRSWLCCRLTKNDKQFGLGSRTCLGKHISILEMSKVIPRLVQDFDFVPLRKTWRTENFWFVKPVDFEVRVQRRGSQTV